VRAVAAAVVAAVGLAAWPAFASGQAGVSYRIPLDNPFVGQAGAAPEVYAYGFRNPWRFSFDRETGNLLIGDVGGSTREELNSIGARAAAGRNFGWSCREGTADGPNPGRCAAGTSFVDPLFEYAWFSGAVITAGVVVRDPDLDGLTSRALYADFGAGEIHSVSLTPGAPDNRSTGASVPNLASFGEDAAGRIYVANLFGNEVRRLTSTGPGTLSSTPLTGPWDAPIAIATVPGDSERLLVGERGGRVRLVVGGVAQPGAIATVPNPPGVSSGGERGLLSVAAARDFVATGRLYVYYTDLDGDIRIDEFTGGVRREILAVEHSSFGNHNGGQLQFGSDGCLWITTGDGGSQADPPNNAQTLTSHLGKLLRTDPNLTGPVCGSGPSGDTSVPPPGGNTTIDTPPALRVRAKRRQRVLRLRGAVALARCSESCRLTARGRLRIGRASYPVTPLARAVQADRRVRLKLRLSRRGNRALRRCARRGRLRRASVRLNVRATDPAGLRSPSVRRTVRVRR
jgi:glucose/arabinose dehydrogenase